MLLSSNAFDLRCQFGATVNEIAGLDTSYPSGPFGGIGRVEVMDVKQGHPNDQKTRFRETPECDKEGGMFASCNHRRHAGGVIEHVAMNLIFDA